MKNVLSSLRERLGMPAISNSSRGMTLIEIIIVVALLATLMAILVTNVMQKADQAKEDSAKIGMAKLSQNLQLYKVHNNKFPTTDQGLQALLKDPGTDSKRWRGPYADPQEVKDPWGNDYGYESDGTTMKITSTTPGGKVLTFPEEDENKDQPAK